jgi:TonB family protein
MDEMITYLVKACVCMILFFELYVLTLKKETHFRFNRIYLLASIYISLILPLLNIPIYSGNSDSGFSGVIQTVQVGADSVLITEKGISSAYVIMIIYLTGVIILSAGFISRLFSLMTIRKQCVIEEKDDISIAYCKKPIAPFSFFSTIYIDETMINDKHLDKIIMHETIHINELHSLDIIFVETICVLTWFNPFSWLIKAALKETHEYLADSGVSEQASGSAEYFLLLIKNAIGVQPGLANNFNKSLTLKRLNMMKKPRSGPLSFLKVLPVIPLLAVLFMAFSCSNSTDDLNAQNSSDSQKIENAETTIDKIPEFPGGQTALTKFILDNVKYPEDAKKNGIEGKVLVSFTVTKTGKLDNINVNQKVNDLLDAEAIRVVSAMPDWTPGEIKGAPIDVEMVLPIQFKLDEK